MPEDITRAAFCEMTGIQVDPKFTGVTLFGWLEGRGQAILTYTFVEDATVQTEIRWLERLHALEEKPVNST